MGWVDSYGRYRYGKPRGRLSKPAFQRPGQSPEAMEDLGYKAEVYEDDNGRLRVDWVERPWPIVRHEQVVRGYRCFQVVSQSRDWIEVNGEVVSGLGLGRNYISYAWMEYLRERFNINIEVKQETEVVLKGQSEEEWVSTRHEAYCKKYMAPDGKNQHSRSNEWYQGAIKEAAYHLSRGRLSGCGCGIYAYKSALNHHVRNENYPILTVCRLWGRVLEAELGYQAQYADIEQIYIMVSDLYGVGRTFPRDQAQEIGEGLRKRYGVPVWLVEKSHLLLGEFRDQLLPDYELGAVTDEDKFGVTVGDGVEGPSNKQVAYACHLVNWLIDCKLEEPAKVFKQKVLECYSYEEMSKVLDQLVGLKNILGGTR